MKITRSVYFGGVVGAAMFTSDSSACPERGSDDHSVLWRWMDRIEDHCRAKGDYPARLEDVEWRDDYYAKDAFEHVPTYRKLSSGFELFLNGRAGVSDIDNNIFPLMLLDHCIFRWLGGEWRDETSMNRIDPVDQVGQALDKVVNDVRRFLASLGECPEVLDETFWIDDKNPPKCIRGRYSRTDPWGERYVIRKAQSGYQLFSMGPDRKPDTEDDIYPGDHSDRCAFPNERMKSMPRERTPIVCFEQDSMMARKAMEIRRASGSCGCSFIGLSQ